MTPRKKRKNAQPADDGVGPVQLDLFECMEQVAQTKCLAIDEVPVQFSLSGEAPESTDGRSPYSRDVVDKARRLYEQGVSYKTVAYSLGVPIYTAREWMHRFRNGTLQVRVSGKSATGRYSSQIKEQVIRMRTELGMSYNRIVQATGISRTTVRSWLADIPKEELAPAQFPDKK